MTTTRCTYLVERIFRRFHRRRRCRRRREEPPPGKGEFADRSPSWQARTPHSLVHDARRESLRSESRLPGLGGISTMGSISEYNYLIVSVYGT